MWKIEETSRYSLSELNQLIQEKNITPDRLIRYTTVFEQLKQCVKYIITYWINTDDNKKENQ